jgi:hypothetical protein
MPDLGFRSRIPISDSDLGFRSRIRNPMRTPTRVRSRTRRTTCIDVRSSMREGVRRSCLPALTRKNRAGACLAWGRRGRRHGSFAGEGMQARPPHPPRFLVLDLSIHAIEVLRPIVARIRHHDRDLGEQLRRSLSSCALNVAEGNRSQGGHRLARLPRRRVPASHGLQVGVRRCTHGLAEGHPGRARGGARRPSTLRRGRSRRLD